MTGPKTQTLGTTEARQQFSKLLNEVFREETRVIVEKNGIPVAAIISAKDLEWLEKYEEQRREHFAVLDRIGEKFKDVPIEEIEREVDRAVREVRAEYRAKQEKAPVER